MTALLVRLLWALLRHLEHNPDRNILHWPNGWTAPKEET